MNPRAPVLGVSLLALAFGLCVVWAIGAVTDEEPYPAVLFPAFGRIPSESAEQRPGYVRVIEIETTNPTSSIVELTAAEAFPEAPDSFHLDMLDSLSAAAPSPELRAWAASRLEPALATDDCVTSLLIVERPSDQPEASTAAAKVVDHRVDFGPCDASTGGEG